MTEMGASSRHEVTLCPLRPAAAQADTKNMTAAPATTESQDELYAVQAELDILVLQRTANRHGLHTQMQADRYHRLSDREEELLSYA
jgi:hypothetical protein